MFAITATILFSMRKNGATSTSHENIVDGMIARSFSATVVEEDGTIASVLTETNGVAQVRVTYGKSGHDTYALAPMTVTNGQPVKVIGVTARHSEAPGVLPSFTRVVLPK